VRTLFYEKTLVRELKKTANIRRAAMSGKEAVEGSSSSSAVKKRGRPATAKPAIVSNKYGVRERVLMANYDADDDDLVIFYSPSTIKQVIITETETLYTLVLDHKETQMNDVDESVLFKEIKMP